MEEFVNNLSGSVYEKTIRKVYELDSPTLFDYEMSLDLFFFNYVWDNKNKFIPKGECKYFLDSFGSQVDLLNILWIYRCKKYYQLDSELIYSDIIPIYYKIPRQKLGALIRTADLNAYLRAVKQTPYDALFGDLDNRFIEQNYSDLVLRRSRRLVKKYPFSIASVIGYLHGLEVEIHNITTIIESIRYGTSAFYPV